MRALQLCEVYEFAVAMMRTDWGINLTKLPDFSRPRLEDFLVSTRESFVLVQEVHLLYTGLHEKPGK